MFSWRKKKNDDMRFSVDSFEGIKKMVITVDGYGIELVRLSEIPVMRILPIMAEDNGAKQFEMLLELIKSALLNPADWDERMSMMSVGSLQQCVHLWMESLEVDVTGKGKNNGKKKR